MTTISHSSNRKRVCKCLVLPLCLSGLNTCVNRKFVNLLFIVIAQTITGLGRNWCFCGWRVVRLAPRLISRPSRAGLTDTANMYFTRAELT